MVEWQFDSPILCDGLHNRNIETLLIRTVKKNKSIDKFLLKNQLLDEDGSDILKACLQSSENLQIILEHIKRLDKRFICPLTGRIIKEPVRTFGKCYEKSAIKGFVAKYHKTPCGKNIHSPSIDSVGVEILYQQENELGDEINKYAVIKLRNIIALLKTHSEFLVNSQTELTGVLVELLDLLRPSKRSQELKPLLASLSEYSELSSRLFNELQGRFENASLAEMEELAILADPNETLTIFIAINLILANLYNEKKDYQKAAECYQNLLTRGLLEENDQEKFAILLINYLWKNELISKYSSFRDFQQILLNKGHELNRNEVVISASIALTKLAHNLEEKLEYLSKVLSIDFQNEEALGMMIELADQIAESQSCESYYQNLTHVLIYKQRPDILSRLYKYLRPIELLKTYPNDIRFISKIANSLQEIHSKDLAIEVYNLLGSLLFNARDYSKSTIATQHILEYLDKTNEEALDRLNQISVITNQLSISAKYVLRNAIDLLFGEGLTEDAKSQATILFNSLLTNFEAKIDKGGSSSLLSKEAADRIAQQEARIYNLEKQNEELRESLRSITAYLNTLQARN